jgi:hypothetical protein
MTATVAAVPRGEPRAGRDRDGRPAPRWAVIAAHLVTLVTLPAGLWRIALALGASMGIMAGGRPVGVHGWGIVYVFGLSVVSETVALLTLGLVRPWGEQAPDWIPLIGGRRLAPMAVVVPAAVGAVLLQVIWVFAFRGFPEFGRLEFQSDGWKALMIACYLPLLLWSPLLAAVTWAYYRRRCRD